MPSKEQTSHAKGDNSESLDITVPDVSDDTELCQYCKKCFTECAQRLQQQNVIDVSQSVILVTSNTNVVVNDGLLVAGLT